MSATHGGKGDSPRPVNPKQYGENYDRIFRKRSISKASIIERANNVSATGGLPERIHRKGLATFNELKDAKGFQADPLSILERKFGIPPEKP